MNDHSVTCKDCDITFATAKDFVYHLDSCENNYNPTASLHTQNAAKFLRAWVKNARELIGCLEKMSKTRRSLKKLEKDTFAWLKINKLQGDLK